MKFARFLIAACMIAGLSSVAAAAEDGLIRKQSANGVYQTIDKLKAALESKGLTIFADIDHSAGAKRAELALRPTRLLIFGNPKLGTPLMQAAATTAIDLPQKAVAYRDDDGKVWLVYNDPMYLKQRHAIEGRDEVLKKIAGALDNFTDAAIK
ncbi:DUF302 domain-containing protein [Minwuia sp.]|uniref:DUF302 domain-containing protein n=1 Tax=Minwuia sp. TaxID=2493630 RepID=UPI003A92FADC